ncbi:hypothetical protein ACLOJK_004326 [Asimina triloba]
MGVWPSGPAWIDRGRRLWTWAGRWLHVVGGRPLGWKMDRRAEASESSAVGCKMERWVTEIAWGEQTDVVRCRWLVGVMHAGFAMNEHGEDGGCFVGVAGSDGFGEVADWVRRDAGGAAGGRCG